ncbi:hypothetical protein BY996DRAFT_6575010 [Phakopsora pachyrhizi]|nr:hypothetical protein BY996DRAFT_6575010 [Phakopsora pachyrhizi]
MVHPNSELANNIKKKFVRPAKVYFSLHWHLIEKEKSVHLRTNDIHGPPVGVALELIKYGKEGHKNILIVVGLLDPKSTISIGCKGIATRNRAEGTKQQSLEPWTRPDHSQAYRHRKSGSGKARSCEYEVTNN